ncbi:B3 domain-containing protein At2g24670-like [Lotus japonicus]|uniref:B3 domain-containing protein At2g24670-like n=1 Tax=Lotus japonicus TaxID=34305 RepID=UPI00258AB8CB|nr:B3 domain-containing protein At2g24670-like [Lotus japonicus]
MGDKNKNNKALWEKVNSITNWETRQKFSSKPFKPCFLDMVVVSENSEHAQQFYSEEELTQIKELKSKLGLGEGTSNTTEENQNQRVIRESDEDMVDEEEEEASPKSRMKISVQELPVEFRNRIAELNGHDIRFLMSKILKSNNNCLSLPEKSIQCEFLTEEEKECSGEGAGMKVSLLDPCLREYSIFLKKWEINNDFFYNLMENWHKVVSHNKFAEDHQLHIWSFRVKTKLYFVLNRV